MKAARTPKVLLVHNTTRYLQLHYSCLIGRLLDAGLEVVCVAPFDGSVVALRQAGARCIRLGVSRRGLNPLVELRTLFQLMRIFCRLRPDILINFSVKPVIYGSLAARVCGIGHVFSMITGLGFVFTGEPGKNTVLRRAISALYRTALRNNKAVFMQNPDDGALFVRQRIASNQQVVVLPGTGVDPQEFAPIAKQDATTFSFLLVARLLVDKGIREFVEAARRLRERYPGVEFQLLGPFDDNPAAIQPAQVDRWVGQGVIRYLGESADVRPFIAQADVVVLPSYREGLPRILLEAMAMALPVIATNVPGCRETVEEGKNGFLVPAKDASALAAAMERMLGQPQQVARMGQHSRRLVLEKFTVERVTKIMFSAMRAVQAPV